MAEYETVNLRPETKAKLANYGNATDSMDDVVNKLLKNNQEYQRFIDKIGKSLAFEKFLGVGRSKDAKIDA